MTLSGRLVVAVFAVLLFSAQAFAQKPDAAPIRWRTSVRSSFPADPCKNPDGVPSRLTWFGSDGSAVQEERRTFCSAQEAAAALALRLKKEGDAIQILRDTGGAADADPASSRQMWVLVPDTTGEIVDPSTPSVVHYIEVSGRDYFDLFGSDERHLQLVVDEMNHRGAR